MMASHQDDALNENLEENRLLAAEVVRVFTEIQAKLLEISVGVGKWLLTSLLALNGAGALATWQSKLPASEKMFAGGLFVVGILAALACGALQIAQVMRISKPLGETIGYWITVQVDGLRASDLEDFGKLARIAGQTKLVWLAGLASISLFLAGSGYTVGAEQTREEIENAKARKPSTSERSTTADMQPQSHR